MHACAGEPFSEHWNVAVGSGELNANVAVDEFDSGGGCWVTTVVGGVRSTVQSAVIVIGTAPGSCTWNSCPPSERPESGCGEVQVWNAAPSIEHMNGPDPVHANVADVWLVGSCGVCVNANGGAA